jgi:hypothetical protein
MLCSIVIGQTSLVLPDDFPDYLFQSEDSSDDGNIFISSYSMTSLHDRNYLIIMDNNGEIKFF